ncbi:MAG: tautomerase family protein [Solirubrobacteraceae bacterium]
MLRLLRSISADAGCRYWCDPWRCSSSRPAGSYLGDRSRQRFIIVRMTLAKGRTSDAKRAFYGRVWKLLADRVEVVAEDLAVMMVANGREDWSLRVRSG